MNIVTLAALSSNSFFVLVFLIALRDELMALVVWDLVWNLAYLTVLYLNARGRPGPAAWLLLVSGWGNLLIVTANVGGYQGGYLFLLTLPLLGGLFSRPGDRALPSLAVGLGVVLFAGAPLVFDEPAGFLAGTNLETVVYTLCCVIVGLFGAAVTLYYRRIVDQTEAALAAANARSERLLLNMLPGPIADRLKADESPIADRLDNVTVLFADLVDSTPLAEALDPDDLVALLDTVFSHFDELAERYGLEKIGSIGDGYLAVAGAPLPRADHARAAADMAIAMLDALPRFGAGDSGRLRMRIGLNSGPVVAGVIGRSKYRYDLWGDTVNTASRMESHGEPGRIHMSASTRQALGEGYEVEPRGLITVKGKGEMETYFLLRHGITNRRPAASPQRL